jgi:hypothetical protein
MKKIMFFLIAMLLQIRPAIAADFLDLGPEISGSGRGIPVVRTCANAALVAFDIADFFHEHYHGKDANYDHAITDPSGKRSTYKGEKFVSSRRKLEEKIEKSDLPMNHKIRLQGLFIVQWNTTTYYRTSPSELASNYYLRCMDMAYK